MHTVYMTQIGAMVVSSTSQLLVHFLRQGLEEASMAKTLGVGLLFAAGLSLEFYFERTG